MKITNIISSIAPTSSSTTSEESTNSAPYKSYKLVSDHAPSRRDMKLQEEESETTYSIQAPRLTSDQRPEVHLRDATNSKTLATAQVRRSTSAQEFAFRLADTSRAYFAWTPVRARNSTESCFEFRFSGCPYTWIRTHSAELGASRWTGRCYKLVQGSYDDLLKDSGGGNGDEDELDPLPVEDRHVLMAYNHSPWFDRHAHYAGEIRVYGCCGRGGQQQQQQEEEKDEALELAGIITALGIQQREREMRAEGLREMGKSAT